MMLNLTFGEIMNVMDILEFVRKEILVISKEVVGVFILHRLWYQCRMILVEFSGSRKGMLYCSCSLQPN